MIENVWKVKLLMVEDQRKRYTNQKGTVEANGMGTRKPYTEREKKEGE